MKSNKKGQAAMEFLMTYGWAILAAVIVIGALAAFGVFNPSTYVPNSCTLAAPFGCNAGIVNTTGVFIELNNGAGETLMITNFTVSDCGSNVTEMNVTSVNKQIYFVDCATDPAAGSKFKGDITIAYKKANSDLGLSSSGSLVSKVA